MKIEEYGFPVIEAELEAWRSRYPWFSDEPLLYSRDPGPEYDSRFNELQKKHGQSVARDWDDYQFERWKFWPEAWIRVIPWFLKEMGLGEFELWPDLNTPPHKHAWYDYGLKCQIEGVQADVYLWPPFECLDCDSPSLMKNVAEWVAKAKVDVVKKYNACKLEIIYSDTHFGVYPGDTVS